MFSLRRIFLFVALALTLGATWWTWKVDRNARPVETVSSRLSAAHREAQSSGDDRSAHLGPNEGAASARGFRDPLVVGPEDPFKAVSFLPQAPPPVVQAPPSPIKPVPPPLPYRYFGRVAGPEGNLVTYLSRDDRLVPIQVGDVLENSYQIAEVTESEIKIVYLPMHEVSQLQIPKQAN